MADTIFALASGAAPSAIAIIRMSGPSSRSAILKLCGELPSPFRTSLRNISDPIDGGLIDRGIVIWFPAPKSFTGEDGAEFHIHGGRAVIRAMLAVLSRLENVRPAQPGEFTKRAFMNGKMDLSEAEGLADLILADTNLQHRQALEVAGGSLRHRVTLWRDMLIGAMAHVAANIDFSDEGDVPSALHADVLGYTNKLIADIGETLEEGRRGEVIRDGFRVVISGPPNVGKSSLLNAISRRDVAIVSPKAGTTRDVIEVRLDINGFPITLIDTAGLRGTSDDVEQEGVQRALAAAEQADLVLWIYDARSPLIASDEFIGRRNIVEIGNKCDLLSVGERRHFGVSALSGEGIPELLNFVEATARNTIRLGAPALITRERHRAELQLALSALSEVKQHIEAPELIAEDFRLACRRLEGIMGVVDTETVFGEIFSRFCIGK